MVSSAPGNLAVTCRSCPSRSACILLWGRPSHGSSVETGPLAPPRRSGPVPPALPAPPRGRPGPASRSSLFARRSSQACCRVSSRPLPPAFLCAARPSPQVLPRARAGSCLYSVYTLLPAPGPGVPGPPTTLPIPEGRSLGGGLDRLQKVTGMACFGHGMLPAWVLTFAVLDWVCLLSGYGQPRKLKGALKLLPGVR